jgi:hypothetical protein
MSDEPVVVETHPIQYRYTPARIPTVVTMRAYEVYCHLYGGQQALVSGDCRGGFSGGEMIAFLYAHSFPKEEWRLRVEEAFRGAIKGRER